MNEAKSQDAPLTATDASFPEIIKKHPLVVVDCWAPWCGPCRMLAPTIDALAKEYRGKAAFAKLNTDENLDTARKFGINAIPTLLLFKKGELVDQMVGVMPKNDIESKIKQYL